jgi:hypothetical protein
MPHVSAPTSNRSKFAVPRWSRAAIGAGMVLLLLACFSQAAGDSDTYLHLRTGRYIWENHRLAVPDPFSFTTYLGTPAGPAEAMYRDFNLTHEWLWQLMLYLVHAAGGFGLMVLLRALALTLACAFVGLVVYRRTAGFFHGIAAALILLAVEANSPILDRPGVVTIFLLTLTLMMLEYRRYLWVFPAIFLVWANAHGAYVMGWVVLGAYCAEAWILRCRGKKPEGERTLWMASAAAVLASGLNPNGLRAIPVLLFYRQSAAQSRIIEWTPPALWPPQEAFTLVLYGAAILLICARGKARLVDWFLYPLFAAAAVMASRNVIFVGIMGAVVIASYFPWQVRLPRWTELLALLALLAGATIQITTGHAFELHADEFRYPTGAAAFLRAHRITGRMMHTFGSGGYLMWQLWPQQKTFVDGRSLNESVLADYQRIIDNRNDSDGKSAGQLLREYQVEVIVAESFEYYTGRLWQLPTALATPEQKEWSLVFADSSGVVFMRHPPADVPALAPSAALTSAEAQCSIHLAKDPAWPGCAAALARLFVSRGDLSRAQKWGAEWLALQSHPDPADVRLFVQLLNAG